MFSRELYRAGRVCWVDWFGEARSITVKCGLGLLKTCFCSLFKSFAHYSNVLLTIQKFCSLLDTFAHYWSLLLTIGHFWKRPAGSKTVITVRYYGNANQEKCTKNGALTDTALSKRHKKRRAHRGMSDGCDHVNWLRRSQTTPNSSQASRGILLNDAFYLRK